MPSVRHHLDAIAEVADQKETLLEKDFDPEELAIPQEQ